MFNRRRFVQVVVVAPHLLGSGALLLLSNRADAFLPIFARFVVGGFVRGMVIRSVLKTLGSAPLAVTAMKNDSSVNNLSATTTREYGKKRDIDGSAAAQFGFPTGPIVSVSANVLAKAEDYGAEAIWIRVDVKNSFELEVYNNSDNVLDEKIAIYLWNAEQDKIASQAYYGRHTARANSVERIPFSISNLPFNGVIKLSAESTASELVASPSGNIVVAEKSDIEFRS